MTFLRILFLTIAMTASLCFSHLDESDGNQYKAVEKGSRTPHLLTEATDRPQGFSSQSILSNTTKRESHHKVDTKNNKPLSGRKRKRDTRSRDRRSYYPYPAYSVQTPQFSSISLWEPSVYPLQRPYFVPIFGAPGRIPIYFPPQPFLIDPSVKPPYVGPTYLPPVSPTPPTEGTTMELPSRFGSDEDDRPIWDLPETNTLRTDAPTKPDKFVPTRKPKVPGVTTHPPLVHNGDRATNELSMDKNRRPSTTMSNNIVPSSPKVPFRPAGPSRCVWAIVSCCSTSSRDIIYNCFDQLGCQGPFWDVSPCESDFAKAAIEAALKYYNSG